MYNSTDGKNRIGHYDDNQYNLTSLSEYRLLTISALPMCTANVHCQCALPMCTANLHCQCALPMCTANVHCQCALPMCTVNVH